MTSKDRSGQGNGTAGANGTSSRIDTSHLAREKLHYLREVAPPSRHEHETTFLRQLMLYEQTEERVRMEEKMAGAERNERCARRAVWLMVVVTGLSLCGFSYSALFLDEFPQNSPHLVIRIFGALGLASFISLLAYTAIWLITRGELNAHREVCRGLVSRMIKARLGNPTVGPGMSPEPR